jgi:hypothetical protein
MLDFFGAEDGAARTHQVHTEVELEAVLTPPELEDPKGVHVSEIFLKDILIYLSCLLILNLGSSCGDAANEVRPATGSRDFHGQDGFSVATEGFR